MEKKYYKTTKKGQVLGVRNRPLSLSLNHDGYLRFTADPSRKRRLVHRELASMFGVTRGRVGQLVRRAR